MKAEIKVIDGKTVVFYNKRQRWNGYTVSWSVCNNIQEAVEYCNRNGYEVVENL